MHNISSLKRKTISPAYGRVLFSCKLADQQGKHVDDASIRLDLIAELYGKSSAQEVGQEHNSSIGSNKVSEKSLYGQVDRIVNTKTSHY